MAIKFRLRTSSLIVCFWCSVSFADTPLQVNVSLAPFSEQLSQPTITAIHKDSAGFLWIGTQSGLNRYDGSNVTIFNSNDPEKHWVPASDISQIAEDSDGNIWIATYGGGLARYNSTDITFEAILGNTDGTFSFLKSLFISTNGKIWFGTRDSGIGMYDPQLQRYTAWIISHTLNKHVGQPSDFLEDVSGRIWVSGKDGLFLVDPQQQSIDSYPLPEQTKKPNSLSTATAIEFGSDKTIWIGTSDGVVFEFNTSTLMYNPRDIEVSFPESWITDLAYASDRLWISTDNGLFVVNQVGQKIRSFAHSNSSLSSDVAICLLPNKGSIYVGTDRGLNVLSDSFFEKYQNNNSHIFDDVSSFSESSDHDIWIGTFDGVYQLDPQNHTHKSLESIYPDAKLSDRRVTTLDIKNSEIWLGYFQGGVQVIHLTSGSSRLLDLPNNTDLAVTKIKHGTNGDTWIGTYNQGLYRVTKEGITSYYKHSNMEKNIPEITIMFIIEANDGSIIVGGETALYRIDVSSGSVNKLELSFHKEKAWPVILSMSQNANGDVWIGVKDLGLYIWSIGEGASKDGQPKLVAGNSDLPSSTIYAIEFDKEGNAWVSTTGGISKLSSHGELLKSYTTADGLQGNDFSFASSFRDSKGRLYFGGSNGYNRFDPARKGNSEKPPPVVLTSINIAGLEPRLPVAVHELEALELSHKDYFTTLGFSVLDFADPKNNRYRYRLINFDPEWIENGTRNNATYTNLPSGIYTFQVQGASSAGIWNREGTSLTIVAHPAPWWSWQAYVLYFTMLGMFVFAVKKYYDNNALRKKAAIMTREAHDVADHATDQLQEQLEYQDEFVKIVHAHNISTLELIGSFITQEAKQIDDDFVRDSILNNTRRVAALASLEGCLFYQGDQLLGDLEAFTNLVIGQLLQETPRLENSVITINEIPSRLIPTGLATPLAIVIFELLHNCFCHAFEETSKANYIQVILKKDTSDKIGNDRIWELSVTDNGVGIPNNISPDHIETSGLLIVSSITKQLGGELTISRHQGTSISIVFPSQWDII